MEDSEKKYRGIHPFSKQTPIIRDPKILYIVFHSLKQKRNPEFFNELWVNITHSNNQLFLEVSCLYQITTT